MLDRWQPRRVDFGVAMANLRQTVGSSFQPRYVASMAMMSKPAISLADGYHKQGFKPSETSRSACLRRRPARELHGRWRFTELIGRFRCAISCAGPM
jgi:hypothetical protein